MFRLILLLGLVTFLEFSSCNFDCGLDSSSNQGCRDLSSSLKKTQISGFGACGSAAKSRKLEISCAKNSGSNGACTSRSNGSGYFVVLAPNNAQGNFSDTNYSINQGNGVIGDCNTLWNAINAPAGLGPSDLVGVYVGNPSSSDAVTCTDTGGCHVISTNCFSTFDYVNAQPSGVTASIPNGDYLACAFIDSPYTDGSGAQHVPPLTGLPAGLIANVAPNAFASIALRNPTTTPLLFNTWVDYQNGTDACSTTTNSRKIKINCAASSGSNSTCGTRSDQTGYFVVIVPNNNGGSFIDSNYSTTLGNGPITSCSMLWSAMSGTDGNRPTDILAYYHGDPAAGDAVSCDGTNGCTVASSLDCFSAWDSSLQAPSGVRATINNGTYLSCTFIDSPYADGSLPAQGTPPASFTVIPGAGLIGDSAGSGFGTAVFTSPGQNPITFSTWVNY